MSKLLKIPAVIDGVKLEAASFPSIEDFFEVVLKNLKDRASRASDFQKIFNKASMNDDEAIVKMMDRTFATTFGAIMSRSHGENDVQCNENDIISRNNLLKVTRHFAKESNNDHVREVAKEYSARILFEAVDLQMPIDGKAPETFLKEAEDIVGDLLQNSRNKEVLQSAGELKMNYMNDRHAKLHMGNSSIN